MKSLTLSFIAVILLSGCGSEEKSENSDKSAKVDLSDKKELVELRDAKDAFCNCVNEMDGSNPDACKELWRTASDKRIQGQNVDWNEMKEAEKELYREQRDSLESELRRCADELDRKTSDYYESLLQQETIEWRNGQLNLLAQILEVADENPNDPKCDSLADELFELMYMKGEQGTIRSYNDTNGAFADSINQLPVWDKIQN